MDGRCYVELGRPLLAVPILTEAIARYPRERLRETALYETWLAQAYLQAREPEAAQACLSRAAELADGVRSERLQARLAYLTG